MFVPSMRTQVAVLGIGAAGLGAWAAQGRSDKERAVAAGGAGLYGLASAWGGYRTWGAISAGAIAGAALGTGYAKLTGADASAGAGQLAR